MKPRLKIHSYRPELAIHFQTINEAWIRDMFVLEEIDRQVLADPEGSILRDGGEILFVEAEGLGIVGAGALMRSGEGEYELTKMGVLKESRGLKAGEFLLEALIRRADELGAKNLYLLTNRKCEAAIHLYEKLGFEHDAEIMRRFGCEYARCDVAMRFRSRSSR